ncbi:MAG: transposase [Acidobacteria bacterium]|nr:transposase [Acidobacteriota bacterium]
MSQDINGEILEWSTQQWGSAQLGDRRRTNRAVKLGAQLAAQPSSSIPNQTGSWGETKAAYLLLNEEDVTHGAALSQGHWDATRHRARLSSGVVLFIQDGTELDYTHHPETRGLGRLNESHRQGFLVQLFGDRFVGGLVGVGGKVWTRAPTVRCRTEGKRARSLRANESDVWAETLSGD